MTLTRSYVAEQLRELVNTSLGHGIEALYRDGGELSEDAIASCYRDVKRCIFCGKRSQVMGAQVASVEPPTALAIGGPNKPHVRLMLYGMCHSHQARTAKDPEDWSARLEKRMTGELARRINDRARAN